MMESKPADAVTGIMIILDGLGDRPVEALDDLTPLEAAETPHLDAAAARGVAGMVRPLQPWVPVGTQVGTALLMGLAPSDVPLLSRGPVEAAGAGLDLVPEDVAFRCNYATLEPNGTGFGVTDRRAGRIDRGTHELAEAIDGMELFGGVQVGFRASTQHRAVVRFRGVGLSPAVTDTDPGAGSEARGVLASRALVGGDEDAERTASLVNEFVMKSHKILSDHPVNIRRIGRGLAPANGLLTRGAGAVTRLRNYVRHLGLKTAVIAGEGTVHGLSYLFGFTTVNRPEFTATTDTDLEEKVGSALVAIENNDLVYLHIKGPDVAAHDLDAEGKRDFISAVDAALAPLLERDIVVAVTGDHSTDSVTGRHTGDPVPAFIVAPRSRRDDVRCFGEQACLSGALGHLTATSFMTAMLDHMHVLQNYRGYEDDFIR